MGFIASGVNKANNKRVKKVNNILQYDISMLVSFAYTNFNTQRIE